MSDDEILHILNDKGDVEIFEKDYKAFTTIHFFTDTNNFWFFPFCQIF
jgi:adenine-specific DNA methylase